VDQASLTLADFEPISPEIEARMTIIKGKSNASYFSRSSTMADDDDVIETAINWEDSLTTAGAALGSESFLEEGVEDEDEVELEAPPEEAKPVVDEVSTKFRKIF
jgi:hypothetical protein